MTKRMFDIVISALGLLVLAIPMLIIGMLVRLDSPGPALFRQERVGRGGSRFDILKFRTMRVSDDEGLKLTASGDARVTRLGAVLRSTKIDELPQLINVLAGDMSLVGPRPEVPEYAFLLPEQHEVWNVRPGITDPTAVALRDESALLAGAEDPDEYYRTVLLPEKTAAYVEYARTATLRSDVEVILRTLGALLFEIDPAEEPAADDPAAAAHRRVERWIMAIVVAYALLAQRLFVPRGPGEAVAVANVLAFAGVALLVARTPSTLAMLRSRLEASPWLTLFLGTGLVLPILGVVVGYPWHTLYGVQLGLGLTAFCAIGVLLGGRPAQDPRRFGPALAVIAWSQFAYGAIQALYYTGAVTGFLTRWVFLWDWTVTHAYGVELYAGRSVGLYLNPNVYSMLGALLLVIATSIRLPRRAAWIIAMPAAGIVWLGGSRTAMIALAIVFLPALWRRLVRLAPPTRRRLLLGVAVVVAVALVALLSSDVLYERYLSRWTTLPAILTQGFSADKNLAVRVSAWGQAIDVWRTVPFGTFGPPQMATAVFFDNEYVQLLVQGGALYLALFLGSLAEAYRNARGRVTDSLVGRSVALLAMSAFTLISASFPPTMCLFWPVIGSTATHHQKPARSRRGRRAGVWYSLAAIVAGLTVVALIMRLTGTTYDAFRL